MIVLGLDCATVGCSAALSRDGDICAVARRPMERGQAEVLNTMIGDVMAEAASGFDSLDRIGVTVGPGSFTGVRIGLAAARALGLALGIPVIGVTTFAALMAVVPERERKGRTVVVAVNGKRRDVFVQMFDDAGQTLSRPGTMAPETLADDLPAGAVLMAGDGVEILRPGLAALVGAARVEISSALAPPDAAVVAGLAAAETGTDFGRPRPLYIRPPDVTRPAGRPGTRVKKGR